MNSRPQTFARALAALLVAGASHAANAHHSPALFDLSNVVTVDATVTRFEWVNPHAFVHVELTRNGRTEVWRIEADAPSVLIPLGWSRDSLKPGDRVTVEVSPHRNAQSRALLGPIDYQTGRHRSTAEADVRPWSESTEFARCRRNSGRIGCRAAKTTSRS